MSRFYIEGDEIDVQDPLFFLPEQLAIENKVLLENYILEYTETLNKYITRCNIR